MTIQDFTTKLKETPKGINFSETISIIETNYEFTPTSFSNGNIQSNANENLGSCKVFAFALDQKLTAEETLACFGQYYFEDVLENPNGNDHLNIRNFMKTGFEGVSFEKFPLKKKI